MNDIVEELTGEAVECDTAVMATAFDVNRISSEWIGDTLDQLRDTQPLYEEFCRRFARFVDDNELPVWHNETRGRLSYRRVRDLLVDAGSTHTPAEFFQYAHAAMQAYLVQGPVVIVMKGET